MQKPSTRMGPKPPSLALLLVLLLLIGIITTATIISQRRQPSYSAHDHDRDGRPDHGSEAHE